MTMQPKRYHKLVGTQEGDCALAGGVLPTQAEINAVVEARVARDHAKIVQDQAEAEAERNAASALRKAIEEQIEAQQDQGPDTLLPLYQALAEAARREAVATNEAFDRIRKGGELFHRKRAEVYREAFGRMRELAEAGQRVPELEQRLRSAEQAREHLGAILRHVKPGTFLFTAGPLDVFEGHLSKILRLLSD